MRGQLRATVAFTELADDGATTADDKARLMVYALEALTVDKLGMAGILAHGSGVLLKACQTAREWLARSHHARAQQRLKAALARLHTAGMGMGIDTAARVVARLVVERVTLAAMMGDWDAFDAAQLEELQLYAPADIDLVAYMAARRAEYEAGAHEAQRVFQLRHLFASPLCVTLRAGTSPRKGGRSRRRCSPPSSWGWRRT